jgi:hypothetical protein
MGRCVDRHQGKLRRDGIESGREERREEVVAGYKLLGVSAITEEAALRLENKHLWQLEREQGLI